MDTIKNWLVEVGLKTMGPSAIRGAILGIAGIIAAKNGMLNSFGVTTANGVTSIDWSHVSSAVIALLPALGAAVIKMLNYHGSQVVTSIVAPSAPAGGQK